jgi:hypothetical protein
LAVKLRCVEKASEVSPNTAMSSNTTATGKGERQRAREVAREVSFPANDARPDASGAGRIGPIAKVAMINRPTGRREARSEETGEPSITTTSASWVGFVSADASTTATCR